MWYIRLVGTKNSWAQTLLNIYSALLWLHFLLQAWWPIVPPALLFLFTENYVINVSPLGGAVGAVHSFQRLIPNGRPNFLLMFDSNCISIMHRFRDNDAFLQTGNDVMVLYPLGALYAVCNDGFWKADYGFLVVFHRKCSSIIHRFRDNVYYTPFPR